MRRTFVVLGAYRGGTSLVAGLLRIFGIMMGERFDPTNNHEDLDLRQAPVSKLKELIKQRNEKYDIWGWKDPSTIDKIYDIIDDLRNPKFIVVFRDPYAIALSEHKYMGADTMAMLERAQKQNQKLVEFARRYSSYLISYEKLIRHKDIEGLAKFCGIELTPEIKERALKFIQPEHYVEI